MNPWMRKPLQKCSKYGLTLIRQCHLFNEWQGHNSRSSIQCQTRTRSSPMPTLNMYAHVLGSVPVCFLICDGAIPQQAHQRVDYLQGKLHLIALAYWTSQLSTAVYPLFLLVIADWGFCDSCCCLERKPLGATENTQTPAGNQQISNLKFQCPLSIPCFHTILHLEKKKKKIKGTTSLSVSLCAIELLE